MNNRSARPFTHALKGVRDTTGSYADVARRAGYARSTSWLTKLASAREPWSVAHPPTPACLPALARMFGVSEARVREMVAQEWFGVDGLSVGPVAKSLARLVDELDQDQVAMVVVKVANALGESGRIELRQVEELLALIEISQEWPDTIG